MFRRLVIVPVIVTALCALTSSPLLGQSKEEGERLRREAYELLGKAQSIEDLKRAVQKCEEALSIFRKVGDLKNEGRILGSLGAVYRDRGQYAKAMGYYEKSLELAKKVGDAQGEAQTLKKLGAIYADCGQYAKAVGYYEKSLELAKKVGDLLEEGRVLNNFGVISQSWGQYAKAVEYYEQSLEIYKKVGSVTGEAQTGNNLGQVYKAWGQYAKAVGYYQKSLEIYKKVGSVRGEGVTLTNLGIVYSAWGQYAKAAEYYEKSLEIRKKVGDVPGEGTTLTNLGMVYATQGEYSKALTAFQKGLEICKSIGAPTGLATFNIGNLYLDMGEVQKAEPFIREGNYSSSLGRLSLMKADYPSAKKYYERVLKSAEQNRNADNLFTGYTGLGKAYEGLEDYKKAEEYYEKGMQFTEELRSALLPVERKNFFEVRIHGFSRVEPAKGLTRVRMKLNQGATSIDSSEVTRARAFSDAIALRSQAGVAGVPRDILAKEEVFVTRVAALKKEREKKEKDKAPERYSNITKEIEKAEAELNKFVEMLWEKYKAYAAVKYPRPATLKESSLRPQECVVMFDVSGEGVGVWLIKGKEIAEAFFTKWNKRDLEKDVKRFRQSFEHVKLGEFDPELGQALYQKLLSRVLARVPEGSPLVVMPDGILAILPFEALVVSGTATWKGDSPKAHPEGLAFLGDLYPISYHQSITALTLVRTLGEEKKPGERVLVIADPVFDMKDRRAQGARETGVASKEKEYQVKLMAAMEEESGIRFERLPETATLASNLGSLFNGQSDLYTGMDATKERFMKTIAPGLDQYRWAVFATHGIFSNTIPGLQEPFLALTLVPPGTDGLLTLSDVMSLKLNADLVALTACQMGLGKELSGEGVMSMGRAFQYAGARSILMSLWSVEEKASVQLMESFFRQMKEGKSKLDALRLARDEVRKAGYDHPFFWASFILVGEVE